MDEDIFVDILLNCNNTICEKLGVVDHFGC